VISGVEVCGEKNKYVFNDDPHIHRFVIGLGICAAPSHCRKGREASYGYAFSKHLRTQTKGSVYKRVKVLFDGQIASQIATSHFVMGDIRREVALSGIQSPLQIV
jgi:hypothetical protein